MNPCILVDDRLEAFLEELLTASERRQVENHLVECADCRAAFKRAKEIEGALRAASEREAAVVPDVAAGLGRLRHRMASRNRWKEGLPMAAAALIVLGMLGLFVPGSRPPADVVRSARSGPWSDSATWENGAVPGPGSRVQVRAGHTVVYDVVSDKAIRLIHVAGTLTFARDRDTRLDVGLIKVHRGDHATEDGFDCGVALAPSDPAAPRATLEVGRPGEPVDPKHQALIRLVYFEGTDKDTCPAIVSCGGRMEFHGAPMSRTWVKLGATAKAGDAQVVLSEEVTGWRPGDRLLVTATQRDTRDSGTRRPGAAREPRKVFTEERVLRAVEGTRVTLDAPLQHEHRGEGDYRGEVANLSRNVIVESAEPDKVRGHTMYHRHSAGSISYAEFRHLGKEGVLGKYSLHFHLIGDTMRGSYVLGASIWDSGNRWITIHGTNYLVVRDCVGYRSVGHGFFLEDGTEAYNVLDRNLAVQAFLGKRLPQQVLPFDPNDGAGFWWANNLNTFTRNVACENDRYGYRAEATPSSRFSLALPVRAPDGTKRTVDIRTLPFVRFEGNEAHSDGLYGFRLGECVKDRTGPDEKHPYVIRDMKIWDIHYAFRPEVPSVLVEDMKIWRAVYGVYHPDYDRHVYRRMYIGESNAEPFNRGHDDNNQQFGVLTVDGLTMERCHGTLIQVSQYSPGAKAECHFRNVTFKDNTRYVPAYVATTGNGQPKNPPPDDLVPYYFHDWLGAGRTAKLLTERMVEKAGDGLAYGPAPAPFAGKMMRMAEAREVAFPDPLKPVDDLPPTTVITSVSRSGGRLLVRGTAADDGAIRRVSVNGREARAVGPNFLEWEVEVDEAPTLTAAAEDAAGNAEKTPHERPAAP
jgi:hypothetical protein